MRKRIQWIAALPGIIATAVAMLATPDAAATSINILLSTDKKAYAPGDTVRVTARAFYEDATPVTKVKEARYESKAAKGSFANEGNGVFTCSFAIEEDAEYRSREFKAKITDANGVEKEQKTVIYLNPQDGGDVNRSLSMLCTLVTDKYSYERGETIHVTVEAVYEDGSPVVKARRREIEIKDGRGETVVKGALSTTGDGVFSYGHTVGAAAAPGAWRIRVRLEDSYRNKAEAEVNVAVDTDDADLPAIRIPVATEKGTYFPGETIHFSVLALRADGSPAIDIEETIIEIRDPLDTTIVKTALTEAGNGLFTYAFPLPSSAMQGTWKISVKITEAGGLRYQGAAKAEVLPGSGGNLPPTAYSQNVSTAENTPVSIVLSASDPNGDPLTYSVAAPPANGTLSGVAPNLTYAPNPGYTGTDGFTFVANDGQANSNIATVSISVTAVNQAPVASDGAVTTAEDTSVAISLAANDPDGDALVFTVVTAPAHGSLSGAAPNLTYTPNPNFNGADSLRFKVNDGQADSNVAVVAITVTPVNDLPVAQNQAVVTKENTAVAVSLAAVDPDGDALTYSIVSPPSNGALTGTAPNLTYTPASGYNGPDAFTFKANDGQADSNVASVSISVNAVNDPPVADDKTMNTAEDNAVAVVLTGADPDGDAMTYKVMTSPAHGTLSGTPPNLMYTPNADYNGADSFTFMCNDGQMDSNVATVSIAVSAVNDAPVAQGQSITTSEGSPRKLLLSASDVDGDSLSYNIVSPPAHGTLSGTAPDLTYTPDPGYNGSDSFTFRANDGKVASNIATVSVVVTASNDAPVAQFQSVDTPEDTPVAVVLQAIDPDGDALTYSVASGPTNGSLSGEAPNVTYTPDPNYNGSDSFSFKANDGQVDSNVATVSINVTPVNDPPTANDQSVNTSEDTAVAVTLSGGDIDGDALTFSVVTGPSHGTLSGTAPNLTYAPAAGYNGADSFTFKTNDGQADSNVATVSISVSPVNDAPTAQNQSVNTNEDTPVVVVLSATDPEGDALTYSVVTGPSNGTLSGTAPNLTYTPNANFHGSDSLTFQANDGQSNSNVATVSINVAPVNDAPVANNQSVETAAGTPLAITLSAGDVDGDALTYSVVTPPSHGSLSGTAPNLTYTPTAGYSGPDSFGFKASDGQADSNVATVSINVTGGNRAPVAYDQSLATNAGTPLAITLTATDPDGDTLFYRIVSWPAYGSLKGVAPNLTYTPNPGFTGTDRFTFRARDGMAESNLATVSITVTGANAPPVADNQSVTTEDNTPVGITLTATDPDGDALVYSIAAWPANGGLTGTPPNLTYTPNPDYSGPDSFTFKARDGLADSNIATVQITVVAVNYAPVADDQSLSTPENTPVAVTLTASDQDGDALTYSIVSGPANGSLSGSAPNLTYTPNAGFNGSDNFTFKANDGTVDSNIAAVTIAVTSALTHPWTTTWTGPGMCVECHTTEANEVHASVHYQWLGDATYMTHGPARQGKLTNAVNSYCINIMGNWDACGKCHVGMGAMPDPTPTAEQLANIDCMLCHQKEYKRKKVDGAFVPDTDNMSISMDAAVQTIHRPVRANCLQCHANSGGGDAVKRGDITMAHAGTTDTGFDFHMATTGADMDCQECHTFTNHRVIGKGSDLRPSDSAALLDCIECHANKATSTGHTTTAINTHVARVACQTCHIRHYAKNAADTAATEATETHRTWTATESTAAPYHPFSVKENDLIPQYKFWNRYSDNYLLYDTAAIDPETGFYPTSRPEGGIDDANSKLYPFKYKTAEQPITVGGRQLIALDTSVFFATGDGDAATRQGLVNMGLSAGEPYEWVFTDTYQLLNHEVPPASQVLQCVECHDNKTQMNLPVNLGYALEDTLSVVCVKCHGYKTSKGFVWVHDYHVTRRGYDCSWCHNFSRPERGLR